MTDDLTADDIVRRLVAFGRAGTSSPGIYDEAWCVFCGLMVGEGHKGDCLFGVAEAWVAAHGQHR